MYLRHVLLSLVVISPFALPASIIKKPPVIMASDPAFTEFVCTDVDFANIYEIITTIADTSVIGLAPKASHLNKLGAEINHVHPLKFLAVVFADPTMKAGMAYVMDSYFKRTNFISGLGAGLDRESIKGKLDMYINDFATAVQVSPAEITVYFQERDWEGLVRYLIQS